jgi:hypothetical protein
MNKTKTFRLVMKSPCSIGWDNLTPQTKDRYCSRCEKVVIDFSGMRNDQIIEHFKNNSGNVCGHVRKTQLQTNYTYTYSYKTPWQFNSTLVKLSLAGLLTFCGTKGFSQVNSKAQTTIVKDNSGKTLKNKSQLTNNKKTKSILQVKLTDGNTGKALTTASLEVRETKQIVKNQKTGNYAIAIPDSLWEKTIYIKITCVGYESSEFTLTLKEYQGKPFSVSLYREEQMYDGGLGFEIIETPTNISKD